MKGFLLAAVVICATTVVATAGAAKSQTLNYLEVSTSFVGAYGFNERGSTPPQVGQGFVLTSDYYKWNGTRRGAKVGTLNAVCTILTDATSPTGKTTCTAIASLPAGKITAVGLVPNGGNFDIPIVGGTGSYAGAKGYVRVKSIGGQDSNNSNDKFVILG